MIAVIAAANGAPVGPMSNPRPASPVVIGFVLLGAGLIGVTATDDAAPGGAGRTMDTPVAGGPGSEPVFFKGSVVPAASGTS